MKEHMNRLLMIGFLPETVEDVLRDVPDADELEAYVLWQEKLYSDQCANNLDEVME